MLQEEKTVLLLNAVYKNDMLNLYEFCEGEWRGDNEAFLHCKAIADELVKEQLVKYNDVQKTELAITAYGRYWMAHGGCLVYL